MLARSLLRTSAIALFLAVSLSACSGGGSNDPDPDPPPPEDTTPPAVPSGLEAVSNDGSIELSWSSVSASDLDGYNVYRDTQSFTSIGDRTPVNGSLLSSPALMDDGVSNGTTYYYRVTAVDTNDNESGPSGEVAATPFPAPPDRP